MNQEDKKNSEVKWLKMYDTLFSWLIFTAWRMLTLKQKINGGKRSQQSQKEDRVRKDWRATQEYRGAKGLRST